MKNLDFEKANILYDSKNSDETKGIAIIEPLEKGFGDTLGNSLRRIIRNSLPGVSVVGVHVRGVAHGFDLIPGSVNDMTEFILNLKNLHFKVEFEEEDVQKIIFRKNEAGAYTAKDLELPTGVSIVNPEEELLILTGEQEVEAHIYIKKGRGYLEADENTEVQNYGEELIIPVDGLFSPIKKVMYYVKKDIRHEGNPNYESLKIEVETNGTIGPKEAILLGSKILSHYASAFTGMSDLVDKTEVEQVKKEKEDKVLEKTIEELDLSVRSYNVLNNEGYKTVGQIRKLTERELRSFKKMGNTSVNEIVEKMKALGFDIPKN